MASAHITVGINTLHAVQLRKFIDNLQEVQQDAARLKAIFDQAALGGDWDALGTLINVSPANAETIYNLLGSVKTELEATFITQTLGRLG